MNLNPDHISYVCFDFDGVILDTLQLKEDGFVQAYHDIDTADTDLIRAFQRQAGGKPRDEKFHHFDKLFLARTPDEARLATLSQRLSDHIMAGIEDCPYIRGFSTFVATLRSLGLPLAIASAMPAHELHEIITLKGIAHHFTYAYGAPRPKVDQLKDIDAEFRQEKNGAPGLYFGDTMSDYHAATGAGLNFIGVGLNAPFDAQHIPFIEDFTAIKATR